MKKPQLLLFLFFSLTASTLFSCSDKCIKGSGNGATETRNTDKFTKINIAVAFSTVKVKLMQGQPSVKITGDDNLLKMTKTDVSGDELKITTDKSICAAQALEIVISNPTFEGIQTVGNVDISSDTTINVKDFNMELSGSSKVKLHLIGGKITISGSGNTDIALTGQASENDIVFSGNSNLDALDFPVAKYEIKAKGSTNCQINVLSDLNVDLSGAGKISYRGNPTHIDKEHTDGSQIKQIQ